MIYSDHLPQVILVPGFYRYKYVRNSYMFICDWKNFNYATFSADKNLQIGLILYKLIQLIQIFLFTITLKKLKR